MNTWTAAGAPTYAGIGVASLLRPASVPVLFGGRADNAGARTEIRAVYGGLPLGVAAALVVQPRNSALMAGLSGAMAAGRAGSLLLEGEAPSPANLAFLGLESVLALTLLIGHRLERSNQ